MARDPGIYFIINLSNGKIYVGQSLNLKSRIQSHFSSLRRYKHPNVHLQGAFDIYGEENFYPYFAERCPINDLTKRERYWMEYFGSDRCYNLAPAGNTPIGRKHTEETKKKLSLIKTGKKRPPSVGIAVAKANSLRKISDETRKKLAIATKNRITSEETRKKLSEANKGKKLSDEQRKKISDSKKKIFSAFGKSLSINEWSLLSGINRSTLSKRLFQYGWPIEEAVTKKPRKYINAKA